MSAATCTHPRPDLCQRLKRHLPAHLVRLYEEDARYRAKWEAEADGRLYVEPTPAPPPPRRPPCRHLSRRIRLETGAVKQVRCPDG